MTIAARNPSPSCAAALKAAAAALLFVPAFAAAQPVEIPQAEPDDTIGTANATALVAGQAGVVFAIADNGDGAHGPAAGDGTGDFDFFAVAASAGQTLLVDTNDVDIGADYDPYLAVYTSTGSILAENDDVGNTAQGYNRTSFISVVLPSDGTYFVVASNWIPNSSNLPADPFTAGTGPGAPGGAIGTYEIVIALDPVAYLEVEGTARPLNSPFPLTGVAAATAGLELRNRGTGDLVIEAADIAGADAAFFTAGGAFPLTIAAGSTATLPVSFDSGGSRGTRAATLSFSSNDVLGRALPLDATGVALDPALFTVRQVFASVQITDLATADAVLAGENVRSSVTASYAEVNFSDDLAAGKGRVVPDTAFPRGGEDFVLEVTGSLFIPEAGFYTFLSNTDDGARLRIGGNDVIVDDALHGPQDRIASAQLAAGLHAVEFLMFERGGGEAAELLIATEPGVFATFEATTWTTLPPSLPLRPHEILQFEPNDSIGTATPTGLVAGTSGAVFAYGHNSDGAHGETGDRTGDFDFFAVEANAGQTIVVDTNDVNIGGDFDPFLGLLAADGTVLAAVDDVGGDPYDRTSRLSVPVPADGTYYVVVSNWIPNSATNNLPADPMTPGTGDGLPGGSTGIYEVVIGLDPAAQMQFKGEVINRAAITFNPTGVGNASTAILNIRNNGLQDLVIESFVWGGESAANYGVTDAVPVTIGPGQNRPVTLTFDPGEELGNFDAELGFVSNDPREPTLSFSEVVSFVTIELTGPTNLLPPVAFGGEGVFVQSVRNSGVGGVLEVSEVRFTGPDAALFSVRQALPLQVESEAAANLEIVFTPDGSGGRKTVTVEIVSNDPNNPVLTLDLTASAYPGGGLVFHYPLDEPAGTGVGGSIFSGDLVDASGNETPGRFFSNAGATVTFGRPPLVAGGTSVGFGAAPNSYMQIRSALVPSFSYSIWVNWQGGGEAGLFHRDHAFNNNPGIYGAAIGADGSVRFSVTRQLAVTTDPGVILPMQTHHIVVTHLDEGGLEDDTADRSRIYVDGVLLAEVGSGPGFRPYEVGAREELWVGTKSGGQGYGGDLDDFQHYDLELDTAQVAHMFANPGDTAPFDDPNLFVQLEGSPFGVLPVGAAAQERTIVVSNSGKTQNLDFSAVQITGADAASYSLVSAPASLAAGAVGEIVVGFDPAGADGGFRASLELETNDQGQATILVDISARVEKASGLLAHFRMDEADGTALLDGSGNRFDGSYETTAAPGGSFSLGQPGIVPGGTAVRLGADGAAGAGFAALPEAAGLPQLDALTFAFWVEVDPAVTGAVVLLSKGESTGDPFALAIAEGSLNWFVKAQPIELDAVTDVSSGEPHHIAVTQDGADLAIYVDGVRAAGSSSATAIVDEPGTLRFGAQSPDLSIALGLTGLLDDVQIYGRALDAAEVALLFANPGKNLESDFEPGGGDRDGDGLSDAFEALLGTDPDLADSDGDGTPDGLELANGADPGGAGARFVTFSADAATPGAPFRLDWQTRAGLTYRVETKADIRDASWTTAGTFVGDGGPASFTDGGPAAGGRFFRLVIVLPGAP